MILSYDTFSRLLPVFRSVNLLEPKGVGGRPGLGHCAYSKDSEYTFVNASGLNQTVNCNTNLSFIPAGPTVSVFYLCLLQYDNKETKTTSWFLYTRQISYFNRDYNNLHSIESTSLLFPIL